MSIINSCYDYIIGLTKNQCECYDIPADASTSLSELYIDDLAGLSWIQGLPNCDQGDLFAQMSRARDLAITTFQADTNAALMQGFQLKRQNYNGSIGRVQSQGTVSQAIGTYYGVRVFCDNVKSGVMVVKSIGTLFTLTDTISLEIWNNLGELVQTITLDTEANRHKKNTVSIELPLHSPYVDHLEYYFIYQATANQAKNNDIKCNCGGFKPVFNIDKPYTTYHQQDRNYMWSRWIMAGGYSGGLPDFDNCNHTTNNLMYGLTLDIELKCKINEVLCLESLDFEGNQLAIATALAIQNKSGAILAAWVVNSQNLSRWKITNSEQLILDIKEWNDTYNRMVVFIAEQADVSLNDCLICRDVFEMTRRGIMA